MASLPFPAAIPSKPSDMSKPRGRILGSFGAVSSSDVPVGAEGTALPFPFSEPTDAADAPSALGQAPPSLPAGCSHGRTLPHPKYLPFPHPASSTTLPCTTTVHQQRNRRKRRRRSAHSSKLSHEVRYERPASMACAREVFGNLIVHYMDVLSFEGGVANAGVLRDERRELHLCLLEDVEL